METVKVIRGAGITSVQIWTEKLPGRPFPAYAVLCDINDDGTIMDCKGETELRAEIIKNMVIS